MARRAQNAIDFEDEGSGGGSLLGRTLLWAGLAAIAVGSLALAAQSQTGTERLAHIFGDGSAAAVVVARSAPPPARAVASRPAEVDAEARRLAETVRLLAADRDRLLARLDQLERSLDVTASIPRETPAAPPAASTALPSLPQVLPTWSFGADLPPAAGVPATGLPAVKTVPAAEPVPAVQAPTLQQAARPAAGLVATEQATESVATRTEFGIDIGGDATLEGVRARWVSLKSGHHALLEGLRPVVAIRDAAKPGLVELRLLVGPFANAGAAARLCAALAGSGVPCQPTVFDGQRLALR